MTDLEEIHVPELVSTQLMTDVVVESPVSVEDKPKRRRRTKAEIDASRATSGTWYLVFRQEGGAWSSMGEPIRAAGSLAAVREAAGQIDGVYVAVPSRSFNPVTVAVEQIVKVTIG